MAYLKVGNGLNEYLKRLGNLEMRALDQLEEAAEKGGDVVADAIRAELNSVPTDDKYGTPERVKAGPLSIQKKGLQNSFGIAPVKNENGYVNVKVGFDGYNGLKSRKHPHGQPNAMIARSVVKGTSFMKKNGFVSRGTRKSKDKAEQAMKQSIDASIVKTMGV